MKDMTSFAFCMIMLDVECFEIKYVFGLVR